MTDIGTALTDVRLAATSGLRVLMHDRAVVWRVVGSVRLMGPGERIIAAVTSWPGVSTDIGRFAETEFYVHGRMLGHVHGDHQADIPFPRRVRDELVAAGRAGPHHIHPESTWTTRYIESDADVDEIVELLRINYDRVVRSRAARSATAAESTD